MFMPHLNPHHIQSLNTQTVLTGLQCKKPLELCALLPVGPLGLINIVNWYLTDKRQQRPEERTPGAEAAVRRWKKEAGLLNRMVVAVSATYGRFTFIFYYNSGLCLL